MKKIILWDLTNGKNNVEYAGTAYMPYQERWRERPDETRQPVEEILQGAKSGGERKDEDSIDTHIGSAHVCFFIVWIDDLDVF